MSSLYLNADLEPQHVSVGGVAVLEGAESRHAATVSRVRIGEVVSIGNGRGLIVTGSATDVAPDRVAIAIDRVALIAAPSPAIWLAQALAKGDRDEAAIQAACELGVDGVIPWSAQRSIVKWEGAKVKKGHDRWSAIVRESTKQSIRSYLPEVSDLVTTKQLAVLAMSTRMLVLSPGAVTRLSDLEPDGRDVVLVVGPEGGVSAGELDTLVASGAEAVKLGDTVLRTGTAGPAAIAALNVVWGRW